MFLLYNIALISSQTHLLLFYISEWILRIHTVVIRQHNAVHLKMGLRLVCTPCCKSTLTTEFFNQRTCFDRYLSHCCFETCIYIEQTKFTFENVSNVCDVMNQDVPATMPFWRLFPISLKNYLPRILTQYENTIKVIVLSLIYLY